MGASFTNCHVHASDVDACAKAVARLARSRALLSAPKGGWISVYDETSESQDLSEIRRFTKGLSAKLATDVVALLVHDSDVFIYLLYRKGKLLDQFNSRPDYFGETTAREKRKWTGDFKRLLPFAVRGVTAERIRRVLKAERLFQEQLVSDFSRLVGIDAKRASTGFFHLQEVPHKLRIVHGRRQSPDSAALIASVDKGNVDKVRELLAKGVSPDQKSRFGESILSSAIRFHRKEIALALIKAGADAYSPAETNSIWAAAAHNEREILATLLEKRSPQLQDCLATALFTAVQMGFVEIVGDLLRAGADPNCGSSNGFTPLMAACFRGHEMMWEVIFGKEVPTDQKRAGWSAIVTQLLEAGANVNARAANGMTALMMARTSGQSDIVDILEKSGADPALKPCGPEYESLLEAFRAKKKEAADTRGAVDDIQSLAAAVRSGKGHLDPRVREVILERMKKSCRIEKKES